MPDLRLAGLAVAAWLAALAGLHLTVRATVWTAAVAAALALLAALRCCGVLADRGNRPAATAGSRSPCCSAWSAGRPPPGARLAIRDATAVRALVAEGAVVTADLVLRDDPPPGTVPPGRPPMLLVRVDHQLMLNT
ncbi:hypothetical protein MCBG_05243 [Micromonospora sp. M42]|nr:hypothetical protein MCBG_05243 [Micromonospora sp. M42]